MSKKFLQPIRMQSQYVDTTLQSVIFQTVNTNAVVDDGTICSLGAFIKEPVYLSAYTRAGSAALAPTDLNTRNAVVPAAATAVGVGVIDIAGVSNATGMGNTYRIGSKTIGLSNAPGVPTRFRTLVVNDNFWTGEENATAPLVVGEFAVLATGANAGKWVPASVAPTTPGCYCQVIDKTVISQGVDGNTGTGQGVQAYRLLVVQN